ncbi:hypothetical protein CXG81DRAFT_17038 [Caulochytrium protostelioides]|uniref:Uncharacterized protein n=1 Tax=Caulochytrium protostelioides TaxID=1555241 RepID=A0A4P9XD84_9FUNG|nr:hypothetical protein CXG81DRAFT_17038 [Caulochytrium protostelioides]|eukprot:RKP03415.1 hypothetical protein CXG81DRAFT_17038 [Caulochytrium protostelioides]
MVAVTQLKGRTVATVASGQSQTVLAKTNSVRMVVTPRTSITAHQAVPPVLSRSWLCSGLILLFASLFATLLFHPVAQYARTHMRLFRNHSTFHGKHITHSFFEGWYFKMTSAATNEKVVVITGLFLAHPPSNEALQAKQETVNRWKGHDGVSSSEAFIVVFPPEADHEVLLYSYPPDQFVDLHDSAEPGMRVRVGESEFSNTGIKLNVHARDLRPILDHERAMIKESLRLETIAPEVLRQRFHPRSVQADVTFAQPVHFPFSWQMPGVMGYFLYLPFLECYHNIVLLSGVAQGFVDFCDEPLTDPSDPSAMVAPRRIELVNATVYVEKDHGSNFPREYVWLQGHDFRHEATRRSSVLFSFARVPIVDKHTLLGRALMALTPRSFHEAMLPLEINGVLAVVYHHATGKTFNFGTYTHADIQLQTVADDLVHVICTRRDPDVQGATLKLDLVARRGLRGYALRGPTKHGLQLLIEESIDAEIDVRITRHVTDPNIAREPEVLFDDRSRMSGFEVSGLRYSVEAR